MDQLHLVSAQAIVVCEDQVLQTRLALCLFFSSPLVASDVDARDLGLTKRSWPIEWQ
jgi:hypothetical protein